MCHYPRKHGGEGVDMQKLELALQKEVEIFLVVISVYVLCLSPTIVELSFGATNVPKQRLRPHKTTSGGVRVLVC